MQSPRNALPIFPLPLLFVPKLSLPTFPLPRLPLASGVHFIAPARTHSTPTMATQSGEVQVVFVPTLTATLPLPARLPKARVRTAPAIANPFLLQYEVADVLVRTAHPPGKAAPLAVGIE